jgi:hypothetical protein
MSADPEMLLEKIKALSPQRRAEVEDFVDFLRVRERAEAAERLGQVFDKMDAVKEPPLTSKEVQDKKRAARAERRAKNAARCLNA